jgi:hypothetical protein
MWLVSSSSSLATRSTEYLHATQIVAHSPCPAGGLPIELAKRGHKVITIAPR